MPPKKPATTAASSTKDGSSTDPGLETATSEPRKRSRNGCWPCKARKVKCDETKPVCANCIKTNETCDYSIRLNWGGRAQKGRHSFSATSTTKMIQAPSRDIFISAQNAMNPAAVANVNAPTMGSPALTMSSPYSNSVRSPTVRPVTHAGITSAAHHRYSTGSAVPPRFFAPHQRHESRSPQLPHIDQLDTDPYPQVFSPVTVKSENFSDPYRSPVVGSQGLLRLPPISPSPLHELGSDHDIAPLHKRPRYETPTSAGHGYPSDHSPIVSVPSPRRLSVNSLLSGPPDQDRLSAIVAQALSSRLQDDGTRLYGYDYGFPDLDIPKNNDSLVIAYKSSSQLWHSRSGAATPDHPGQMAFESGGYYAKPVQIRISSRFEPLPESLLGNPMDLLYFHHFCNHTARVLVPYDCPDNPIRTVMPEMAMRNPNLLNMLLAYSASHRAQLLHHKEPANRIALWMRDAFPSLRQALSSDAPVSDASLAIATLLCSLKIVSPNTFDVPMTWQAYLSTARQLIVSRGGLQGLDREGDKYVAFAVKWYCYLEVCGGLSGTTEEPLSGEYYAYGDASDPQNYYIDCFLGFTNRCMGLLAKVASLARQCDAERIVNGQVRVGWRPGDARVAGAHRLRHDIEQSRDYDNQCCVHVRPGPGQDRAMREMQELHTSNSMYHWAGLIHLYRRVLGKTGDDPDVQFCVNSILHEWNRIPKDSTYESCLLLPLFTAGCEVLDQSRRDAITERLRAVEGWGLTHFTQARRLMERSWDMGRPWETLVTSEFFG